MNPESIIIGGLCLGSSLNKKESFYFLENVYNLGIRDIDTGSLYGNGNSELFISDYIKNSGNKFRIHSKIGLEKVSRHDGSFGVEVANLSPEFIINSSLKTFERFNQKEIHRISIHAFCSSIPIHSQLEALKYLMDNNIIKTYGICNFNSEELSRWINVCINNKLPLPKSLDLHFNLFEQKALVELFPILDKYNIFAIPYRVFCRGLLADRYDDFNNFPKNSRANYSWRVKKYITEEYILYLNYLKELAAENDIDLISLILKWTFSFNCISKICIGTSSIKQLKQIMTCLRDLKLNDNFLIEKINKSKLPNNIYELPETFFEK